MTVAAPADAASWRDRGLDRAAVDAYVADYLDRNGLPGAGVAVVKDGKVVHENGFGRADGERVTARTSLAAGSTSKSFTAFAVLQLVDAGQVDLDAPVASYLPRFGVDDPRGSKITVRQLLSHTSGLPNPVIVPPADTLEQAVTRTRDWQLTATPGTSYAYSNANYWVAARLVEVVGGEPFSTYLDQHVFSPLGMTDTESVTTTRAQNAGLHRGHVTAYGGSLPMRELDAMTAGAGGVVTTAHDMARWLAMQTNAGVGPGGARLLAPTLVEESHDAQPGAGRYGLGWSRSGPDVVPKRISHSGAMTGYNAQQDLVPGSGYGVVVLLNSYTPTLEHAYEISSGIIDISTGGSPTPGPPIPTIIDGILGLVSVGVAVLAVRGLRRSGTWTRRRAHWPLWRFGLRLVPQTLAVLAAAALFLVVPALQRNTATPVDAFALWPALMVLLMTLAIAGVVLSTARIVQRRRLAPRPEERGAT